ncbi:cytoplasmic protein [Heyndrickxia oleronia]|uniref:cytoplasmic protein n=1 Tax=Heyndrickxia oleronia TaxID=38875 RepID=UPI00203E7E31|nr:cytoplasmic protein [Heyndrickxia oleronia]MCM3239912.1 cytoplasmic protein [Heyndrickxia oleronia]
MEQRNINIFGSGSSGGGHFDKVKIKGDGSITDDIECLQFKVHGNGSLLGNVKAQAFAAYGTVELHQNIKSEIIKVYGSMDVAGDISGVKISIRGTGDIAGNILGEQLDVKGGISVKGNCEVENLQLDGGFEIDGLLNAEKVNIGMKFGDNRVSEIGGETISIKRRSTFLGMGKGEGTLSTELVEGDHIYLEYTTAKVVRGKSVELGPGCNIELVEYKESLKQHKSTEVKENRLL